MFKYQFWTFNIQISLPYSALSLTLPSHQCKTVGKSVDLRLMRRIWVLFDIILGTLTLDPPEAAGAVAQDWAAVEAAARHLAAHHNHYLPHNPRLLATLRNTRNCYWPVNVPLTSDWSVGSRDVVVVVGSRSHTVAPSCVDDAKE